jgi:hypothetical protein
MYWLEIIKCIISRINKTISRINIWEKVNKLRVLRGERL